MSGSSASVASASSLGSYPSIVPRTGTPGVPAVYPVTASNTLMQTPMTNIHGHTSSANTPTALNTPVVVTNQTINQAQIAGTSETHSPLLLLDPSEFSARFSLLPSLSLLLEAIQTKSTSGNHEERSQAIKAAVHQFTEKIKAARETLEKLPGIMVSEQEQINEIRQLVIQIQKKRELVERYKIQLADVQGQASAQPQPHPAS